MNLKKKSIDVSPELIKATAIQFGALVKAVIDWRDEKLPDYKKYESCPILMASIAFLCGNMPADTSTEQYNGMANMCVELFLSRKIEVDGDSFICPEWEEDLPEFDRDLGDLGLFSVISTIGFHKDFDAIEISESIYPYRELVLDYARIGLAQEDEMAIACYPKVAAFFASNANNIELYKSICQVVGL